MPGDCNLDGTLDLLDVLPFVELILSGIPLPEADTNQDGMVNLLDVSGFYRAFGWRIDIPPRLTRFSKKR